MSTTYKSLPLELWLHVLAYIGDIKDLAQCRLVCKTLDPLAEKAMFSQAFLFPSEKSTVAQLHYHLARNPFLGRHIKQVHLSCTSWEGKFKDPLVLELGKLVFTPEIEEINGESFDEDFFTMLLDIMNDSPQPFSQLKAITGVYLEGISYSQLLLKAKESLEFMELPVSISEEDFAGRQLVLGCLDKFVKLKKIDLQWQHLANVEEMDAILRKLQNVESMKLEIFVDSFSSKSEGNLKAWLTIHVHKDERMKKVHLQEIGEEAYTSNLVDYVVYKYPKLETLALVIFDMGRHLDKVFQSVEQVPHVRIFETFVQDPGDVGMLGHRFKSKTNKVTIRHILRLTYVNQEGAEVDISRNNSTQHTDFVLSLNPDMPHAFAKQLLTSVCTDTSNITELDINLYLYKDDSTSEEEASEISFYTILKMIPHAKMVRFCDEKIEHPAATDLDTLTLNNLTHLQFYATIISPGVFSLISKIAPNLRHLDLFSCLLTDERNEFRKMVIDMPHSNLDSITIKTETQEHTEGARRGEIKKLAAIEKDIKSMNTIYLCVETYGILKQYFALEFDENCAKSITQTEYMMHDNKVANLNIKCKSLK